MALYLEPAILAFPREWGDYLMFVSNPSELRLVVRCYPMNKHRIICQPATFMVDPHAPVEITIIGTRGMECETAVRMVFGEAAMDEADAENAFKTTTPLSEVNLTVAFQ